ncbi:MAG: LLM class oxidoreductase [Betaproteobacteria bacterium]|nr:LLM class oxidoreductase [Betaproteobacteria bacterium]
MELAKPHPGFRRMFASDRLTVGLLFPIEAYKGDVPLMQRQAELARLAERLGFAALWFRDVPLRDPDFGDVGQIYDPWVYLGFILAQTQDIALATGSIILPLRHPLHIAKAAASVDRLSGGRLVMGVASGDRPAEYPAFGVDFATRGERFRDTLHYFRAATEAEFPAVETPLGRMDGLDLLPKPSIGRIPVLVTGHSQQELPWIAEHADGWLYYPRSISRQEQSIKEWRELTRRHSPGAFKPFAQSLYVDLTDDPNAEPEPIHLGFKMGRNLLIDLLRQLRAVGVNHVAINLKYSSRPAAEVLEEIGREVLPLFPANGAGEGVAA